MKKQTFITRAKFLINSGKALAGLTGLILTASQVHLTVEREDQFRPVPPTELLEKSKDNNSPKKQKVILLKTHIAGVYFYEGIKETGRMKKCDKLTLRREPDNVHDKNAIEIFWKNIKIGYVPKKDNVVLASMLDQNVPLKVKIIGIDEFEDVKWMEIYFEVSMKAAV